MQRSTLDSVRLTVCLTLLLPLVISSSARSADDIQAIKLTRTITFNEVGDAEITMQIKAPTNVYTTIKSQTPNVAVLLRQLGAGRHWAYIENVNGAFHDVPSTIEITYRHCGLARPAEGGGWTLDLGKDADLELVDIHGTTALYCGSSNSPFGLVQAIVRIETPKGSTELHHHEANHSFCYGFEPQAHAEGQGALAAKFDVEHRDVIMSCLAKCYSNDHFTFLWAARSRFENAGTALLSNYRVRFRIAGLSAWSAWSKAEKVYPHQSIVDAFYPVFELDKINVLTGSRPAMLEIEYEYTRPDGTKVQESDSRSLTILGRNETIFTGLDQSEILTFEDQMEYLPAVLASFTTPNDPVISQLAGRISGRANGAAASYNTEDAMRFLAATFGFLEQNKVAYQSPPSYVHGKRFGQHIKFGRDVLQNHAGTCIDLAILWASTCEAVGLQSTLIVVPGHCFPAVRLPDGRMIAIEATCVGKANFEKAVEIGMQELDSARRGTSLFVQISNLREQGIPSLDLPAVSHRFFADEGYVFDAPQTEEATNTQQTESSTDTQPTNEVSSVEPTTTSNLLPEIVGQWGFRGQVAAGQTAIGITLRDDGKMAYYAKMTFGQGGCQEVEKIGAWRIEGTELILSDESGIHRYPFWFHQGRLAIYFENLNATVTLLRLS